MSLIWFDGFDDYTATGSATSHLLSSGYAIAPSSGTDADTPHGVGRSMRILNTSGNQQFSLYKALGVGTDDIVMGFHFKPTNASFNSIVRFHNENLLGSIREAGMLIMNAQRGVTWTNHNANVAYAASDANVIFPNVWYFVEVRLNFATGYVTVRLNEEVVLNANVLASLTHQTVNMFSFPGKDDFSGAAKLYDNVYVLDASVDDAPFNDFLGEVVCYSLRPMSDAGANDFSIVGSVDPEHYKAVDEEFILDGDYLTTVTAGDIEMFGLTDLPVDTLEVYAVGIAVRSRKEPAGPAQYRAIARLGVDTENLTTRAASATFQTKLEIMQQKPGGGSWSISDANGLEIGTEAMV